MPSHKRLRSVCHSIAHHAVSGLSYVHPHLRQACRAIGAPCVRVELKLEDPCPEVFLKNEPLHLSLLALRQKFKDILVAEGFTFDDIESVNLTFHFTAEFPDDYSSLCDAKVVSRDGTEYRYVVDYFGKTRALNQGLPTNCI